MFRMFRKDTHTSGEQQPPAVDPATLAGAHQLGRDGSSGMVPRHSAFTDPDAGGRVDDIGRRPVGNFTQLDTVPTPDSWYADRPLFGGVRTAPAFGEFIDEPGMSGGYQVLGHRPTLPQQADRFVFAVEEATPDPEPSFRQPPLPPVCRRTATLGVSAAGR